MMTLDMLVVGGGLGLLVASALRFRAHMLHVSARRQLSKDDAEDAARGRRKARVRATTRAIPVDRVQEQDLTDSDDEQVALDPYDLEISRGRGRQGPASGRRDQRV